MKYALGEMVLVVLGILIALQVNTWNLARQDRIQELKYLRNIRQDLSEDLVSLESNTLHRVKKIASLDTLLMVMDGDSIVDLDHLTFHAVNALWMERFQPGNTTFRELISSGNVSLITNDSIRTQLLEMESLYLTNGFFIDHEIHDYEEYVSRPFIQLMDLGRTWPVFTGAKTAQMMGIRLENFNALLSDPVFRNGCVLEKVMSPDFISLYNQIRVKSTSVIGLIDRELEE